MRYNMEESDLTVSSNVSGYHSLCMYCPCPIFDRFYFLIKWLMYSVVVYGSRMSSWFCATHDIYLNLDFYILGVTATLNLMLQHCTMKEHKVCCKVLHLSTDRCSRLAFTRYMLHAVPGLLPILNKVFMVFFSLIACIRVIL
jgi:hypothetical protein